MIAPDNRVLPEEQEKKLSLILSHAAIQFDVVLFLTDFRFNPYSYKESSRRTRLQKGPSLLELAGNAYERFSSEILWAPIVGAAKMPHQDRKGGESYIERDGRC